MDNSTHTCHFDLKYGIEPLQTYDLYLPLNTTRSSLLILIHGGAWVSGDKTELTNLAHSILNYQPNLSIASINYSLSTNVHLKFPVHLNDCLSAIRHLVTNKGNYNYQTNDGVHLMGHSAGAQLASLIYLNPVKLVNIQSLILTEGIYDLNLFLKNFPQYEELYVSPSFNKPYDQHSPTLITNYNINNKNTKILIIHSIKDELVRNEQAIRFEKRLIDLNCKHIKRVYEDYGGHDNVFDHEEVVKLMVDTLN